MKINKKIIYTLILSLLLVSCSTSKIHTVKRGDTLSKISKNSGVSVEKLKEYNHLDGNTIYPNQKIYLKNQSVSSKTTSRSKGSFHTVRSGDTLYLISKKYDVSITNIKKINKLTDNTIHVGNKIYLGKTVSKDNVNYTPTSSVTYTKSTHSNKSTKPVLKNFREPLKSMKVNSPYGYRNHPVLGRKILHAGVDLHAAMNTAVYSSYTGTVTFAGWQNGYGKIIIINHGNNYETRYSHLNRILIKKGQRIATGQVIGKSGKTGRVTGPHLHFEIRFNGKPTDPMKVF
ncbi:MAG: M23 family metallopeptidase [Psychrilyobacter sp.]|nr:M23 family metallopeptidase [Psychrilyobacter sp.]